MKKVFYKTGPKGRLQFQGKAVKTRKGNSYFVLIHPVTGAEKEYSSQAAAKKAGWIKITK